MHQHAWPGSLLRQIGWLLLWLWLIPGAVLAQQPLVLYEKNGSQLAGHAFSVLVDPRQQLTLTEVRARPASEWRELDRDNINFGYSRAAFWLRGQVINCGNQRAWLLGIRYPLLDYLDVYFVAADGRVTHHASGDRRPFRQRDAADRNFYFNLALAPGERADIYLRVQGQGSLHVPIELSTPQARLEKTQNEHLLLGLYGGALLSMLVYNLLLYLSLRDRSYLYYVCYIWAFGMAQFALNGLAFEYLWPDSPTWGNQATPFFMGLTGMLLTLFSRDFLALRRHWPRADRLLQLLQWTFAAVVPAALLLDYSIPIRVGTACTVASPVILLIVTAVLLRRGLEQARYFLAAFSGLLLGVTMVGLSMFDLTPTNFLTEYGIQIGSTLEITLLSFALAHRMKILKDENEQIQRNIAASLEQKVQDRTRELDATMRELAQANVRLTELSLTDALTGLRNRKHFDEALHTEWRRSCRWRHELGLMMIDIDHFKRVNDTYGHLAGDAALRLVAEVVHNTLKRPNDVVARYGGEEFAVILPQTDSAGITHVAEAIRAAVQQAQFSFDGQPIPLSISIGTAHTIADPGRSQQQLLAAADHALYQAKHQGRNRVVSSTAAAGTPLA